MYVSSGVCGWSMLGKEFSECFGCNRVCLILSGFPMVHVLDLKKYMRKGHRAFRNTVFVCYANFNTIGS